jgi:hypothetical protein
MAKQYKYTETSCKLLRFLLEVVRVYRYRSGNQIARYGQ